MQRSKDTCAHRKNPQDLEGRGVVVTRKDSFTEYSTLRPYRHGRFPRVSEYHITELTDYASGMLIIMQLQVLLDNMDTPTSPQDLQIFVVACTECYEGQKDALQVATVRAASGSPLEAAKKHFTDVAVQAQAESLDTRYEAQGRALSAACDVLRKIAADFGSDILATSDRAKPRQDAAIQFLEDNDYLTVDAAWTLDTLSRYCAANAAARAATVAALEKSRVEEAVDEEIMCTLDPDEQWLNGDEPLLPVTEAAQEITDAARAATAESEVWVPLREERDDAMPEMFIIGGKPDGADRRRLKADMLSYGINPVWYKSGSDRNHDTVAAEDPRYLVGILILTNDILAAAGDEDLPIGTLMELRQQSEAFSGAITSTYRREGQDGCAVRCLSRGFTPNREMVTTPVMQAIMHTFYPEITAARKRWTAED